MEEAYMEKAFCSQYANRRGWMVDDSTAGSLTSCTIQNPLQSRKGPRSHSSISPRCCLGHWRCRCQRSRQRSRWNLLTHSYSNAQRPCTTAFKLAVTPHAEAALDQQLAPPQIPHHLMRGKSSVSQNWKKNIVTWRTNCCLEVHPVGAPAKQWLLINE